MEFRLFFSPIWAIAKRSWFSLGFFLIMIIIKVICQSGIEAYARSICESTNSMFAPDWLETAAAICQIGIPAITFSLIGIFGSNIRIWELKLKGYVVLKEVIESSESSAIETDLLSCIKRSTAKKSD